MPHDITCQEDIDVLTESQSLDPLGSTEVDELTQVVPDRTLIGDEGVSLETVK